jgi:hypothetical protein
MKRIREPAEMISTLEESLEGLDAIEKFFKVRELPIPVDALVSMTEKRVLIREDLKRWRKIQEGIVVLD